MLFTDSTVSTLARFRSDHQQYAFFETILGEANPPLIAVADVIGAVTIIHEISGGIEVARRRLYCPGGFDKRTFARAIGMAPFETVIQPVIWSRLAWHPDVTC